MQRNERRGRFFVSNECPVQIFEDAVVFCIRGGHIRLADQLHFSFEAQFCIISILTGLKAGHCTRIEALHVALKIEQLSARQKQVKTNLSLKWRGRQYIKDILDMKGCANDANHVGLEISVDRD